MTQHNIYLAAYDVRDSRRLSQALHLVRNHATGGQKSVHEIVLTTAEKANLLRSMRQLLEENDRFLLLRLDARTKVLTRGIGQAPTNPDYINLD